MSKNFFCCNLIYILLGDNFMNNNVALVKCSEYNDTVFDSVKTAIDNLGGIQNFVKPGQSVLLKVNAVMKSNPEKCATTHPLVVEAIGKLCKDAGASRVIIADSAGGPFTAGYMGGIFKACGYTDIAEKNGFFINDNFDSFEAQHPSGKVAKKFLICDCLKQVDVIINVTKLKTHSFTGMTNAVKNMFGAVPGLTKVEAHGQYRTLEVFGDFLYDILDFFGAKLVLHLTDAVMCMQGAGPTNGTPKFVGAILAGANPVAVDIVGARLMNYDPSTLPNILTGVDRGYIDKDLTVNIVGENIEPMIVRDFETVVPNGFKPFANAIPQWLQPVVHKLTTQRPAIKKSKCKGCKKCFEHCPVQAITMTKGRNGKQYAKFDYNKCIRCYCCQELCPFGVVKVKSGVVYKLMHLGSKKKIKKQ